MKNRDSLMGLLSKNYFISRLKEYVQLYKMNLISSFAVLFVDLDRFKSVNDKYGHIFGDKYLKNVAKMFTSCFRQTDTVARFGGDEFTIILDNIKNCEELLTQLSNLQNCSTISPFVIDNVYISPSFTVGDVFVQKQYSNYEEILIEADRELYKKK